MREGTAASGPRVVDTSPSPGDEVKYTTCYMCACRCGIKVTLKDGSVRYIEGNRNHPVNRGFLCAKGAAGLGLNGDGRNVVSDGVVQLTCQLLAFAELDLANLAEPGARLVVDRSAERRSQQQDHEPTDGVAKTVEVADGADGMGERT